MKAKRFQCCVKNLMFGAAGVFISSCAVPSAPVALPSLSPQNDKVEEAASYSSGFKPFSPVTKTRSIAPKKRPGLATTQGREISSEVDFSSFTRAHKDKPKSTASMYYNDDEGVKAMSARGWKLKGSGMQSAAGGLVEWGVRSGFRYSKNYSSNGKRLIVGKKGREYSIVIKNKAHSRLEVLVSVDGHSVLSGKKASYAQRGYIIDPSETVVIQGFRTREDAVHAFKFSSVNDSFTQQVHGDARNVGVIGLAVFTEKGNSPWRWAPEMIDQRLKAKPF